jgi:hypothetical protein
MEGQAIAGSHPQQIDQGRSVGYADHELGPRYGLSGEHFSTNRPEQSACHKKLLY